MVEALQRRRKSAFELFAMGIIGTGMPAVPVLAGSAAYAVAESMKWPIGHDLAPLEAKGFYSIIAIATLLMAAAVAAMLASRAIG